MQGRRLATTDKIIVLTGPNGGEPLERLQDWAAEKDIDVSVVELGEEIGDAYDPDRPTLGVTLGGDGTFLEGIKLFTPLGIPQMGVNAGTLAFLARVELEELEAALDEVLRGRATVDSRQKLHVDASGVDATGINDVMIQHVPPENPVDGEYVGQYEGTGLAVSTPTGSTGVSLSAEGPIHMPADNHTLQIVPLHTHSMGVRPIVVSAEADIKIVTREQASLLVDGGRAQKILSGGAVVDVTGSEERAHVVRTSYDDQFMQAITDKLGWGIRESDDGPRELLDDGDVPPKEPDTVEKARQVAKEAARSAGEPLRELHGRVEDVTIKTNKSDIVTEADHQANRIITTVIENEFPDHSIFSEEAAFQEGSAPYKWVIDPVDGTGNFAHGNPQYSVSIGLLKDGEPVMGVVYVPETDEMFHAIAGGDAYKGDKKIVTTDRDMLDESMMLSGYDPDGAFLTHFYQETRGVRSLGSAALSLCYLANGSADGVYEYATYPWDTIAGVVIAEAAGAKITDENGDPYTIEFDAEGRKCLVGSNGPLHDAILEHLQKNEDIA
jgi:myo-inositol-1(or 4)-monophosphatase